MIRELRTYSKKEKNFFLVGLYGQNVIYNIISVGLMVYFTDAVRIPAGIVGTIMFAARLWDAINDYFMGAIVDKTRTKWGKCRPYLIFMPVPIFLITVLCFASPTSYLEDPTVTVLWCVATYILWGMLYTISDIPLWGITARMTEIEEDRTKLVSAARIVGGIGAIIPMVGMVAIARGLVGTTIFGTTLDLRGGFLVTAIMLTLLGTVTFQMAGIGVREKITVVKSEKNSLSHNLMLVFRNKPYVRIILSGIIGSTKMMMVVTSVYLLQWYFANGDPGSIAQYTLMMGGAVLAGGFTSIAFVPLLTKRFEKKTVYNWAHLVCIPPLIIAYIIYLSVPDVVGHIYEYIFMGLLFVAGIATGAPQALQTDMIGDSVNFLESKTGERAEGVSFAGQTFLAKFQAGIASLVAGAVLGLVSYTAHIDGMQAVADSGGIVRYEYPNIMNALWLITTILPAIGCFLSVLPTINYDLTRAKNEKIFKEILSKREGEGNEGTDTRIDLW